MVSDNNNKVQDTHGKYTDAYIDILKTYEKQILDSFSKKNNLKEEFFITIKHIMYGLCFVFAGTLLLSIILFTIMIIKDYNSVAVITGAITTIISSFATMIVSLFKLPKIIADYLFNKKEDRLMNQIIKNIQQYEINAVKYNLENLKIERFKQLNAEVTDIPDSDFSNLIYNTPPQNVEIRSNEFVTGNDINNEDIS